MTTIERPTRRSADGGGPKGDTSSRRGDYPLNESKSEAFFLHVGRTSVEFRLAFEPPDVRTLAVTVEGGFEKTRTRSFRFGHGFGVTVVRPSGADWTCSDQFSDAWSEWQRPARSEPLISRKEWRAL
jgi:hypothetical protein